MQMGKICLPGSLVLLVKVLKPKVLEVITLEIELMATVLNPENKLINTSVSSK